MDPRGPAVRSAAARALRLPEILQLIFLHADMRTLLVAAPRVCREWQKVISHTSAIQRALFFHPEDGAVSTLPTRPLLAGWVPGFPPPPPPSPRLRQNPLLAELFPDWFNGSCPATRLPELEPPENLERGQLGLFRGQRFGPFRRSAVTRRRRAFLRPEASWRRMLVAQPPVRGLPCMERRLHAFGHAELMGNCLEFDGAENAELVDQLETGDMCTCRTETRHCPFPRETDPVMLDGLRMGTFYDMVQHWARSRYTPYQRSSVSWQILWTAPEEIEVNLLPAGTRSDLFLGPPQTRLRPAGTPFAYQNEAVTMLRMLLKWFGGPVVQLFEGRSIREVFSPTDLRFQTEYRFPMVEEELTSGSESELESDSATKGRGRQERRGRPT